MGPTREPPIRPQTSDLTELPSSLSLDLPRPSTPPQFIRRTTIPLSLVLDPSPDDVNHPPAASTSTQEDMEPFTASPLVKYSYEVSIPLNVSLVMIRRALDAAGIAFTSAQMEYRHILSGRLRVALKKKPAFYYEKDAVFHPFVLRSRSRPS
ncbi:hypothetical protein SAICODRAFT_31163 [Saitoella complicata NRRL Y-17804]|uniref:Uncharacterized protein n=1 Tax=Saitoella complicata (strain BCRC 22490 / CBS 7301 / JCM 7358 / NBRC 10748 / NRRL Y-17804) TaxID=698492 RepID=A0A0E9NN91_SAICN|nr:uncharacterized protein SAICODRAFT_31163 [Saitoella complicata NRRL Y-17804]ODQ51839.1 hypothetical protein SAICODRAFT_31163 [Saitoella complicata NRRL Y-17804]GAO51352.1 hypothetical protein G7K_5454-t1 [Saitoella complicata NRRL Y-17804]